MYDDLISRINEQVRILKTNRDIVQYLYGERRRLKELRREQIDLTKDFNPAKVALSAVEIFAREQLVANAYNAIQNSEEFNLDIYIEGFMEAVKNPATLRLALEGEQIKVYANMNRTAGTIEQYANAVTKAREELNIGPNREYPMSPAWRSHMWEEKYYGPAMEGRTIDHPSGRDVDVEKYIQDFFTTIAVRVSNFNSLAPYWSIIEYGTRPLASDTGGTAYPVIRPQRFLKKTADEVRAEYAGFFRENKKIRNDLVDSIKKIENALIFIDKKFSEIESQSDIQPLIRLTLERQLGERFSYVDAEKLNEEINRIISNPDISRTRTLGYTDAGKAIRPRVTRIQRLIAKYRVD